MVLEIQLFFVLRNEFYFEEMRPERTEVTVGWSMMQAGYELHRSLTVGGVSIGVLGNSARPTMRIGCNRHFLLDNWFNERTII